MGNKEDEITAPIKYFKISKHQMAIKSGNVEQRSGLSILRDTRKTSSK
jgi:hypothetical protein